MDNRKIFILFSILVLPGLIFAVFDLMQDDYKPLQIFGPRIMAENNTDTIYHTISDFQLLTQTGDTLHHSDLKEYIYVADFFFTSCPSPEFCPKLSTNMNLLQRKFYETHEVKLISFTVDPETDSVPVLAQYSSRYFAKPKKWYFLTGNRDTIYNLAQKEYFVSAIYGDNEPEAFVHTDKFVLVDKERRIRGFYNGRDEKEVKQLIQDIKVLLFEYTRKKSKENKITYKPNNND